MSLDTHRVTAARRAWERGVRHRGLDPIWLQRRGPIPYCPHVYPATQKHRCNDRTCPARVPGEYHVRYDCTIHRRDP